MSLNYNVTAFLRGRMPESQFRFALLPANLTPPCQTTFSLLKRETAFHNEDDWQKTRGADRMMYRVSRNSNEVREIYIARNKTGIKNIFEEYAFDSRMRQSIIERSRKSYSMYDKNVEFLRFLRCVHEIFSYLNIQFQYSFVSN